MKKLETIARQELKRFTDKCEYQVGTGCWIWKASKRGSGYGQFFMQRYGRQIEAHRASWILFLKGPIPDKMQVLHRCDVRACVNPAHLFLGTAKDNTQDMIKKKRDRRKLSISGIRGVYWHSRDELWIARGTKDGTTTALYCGKDFLEASCRRKSWEASQWC